MVRPPPEIGYGVYLCGMVDQPLHDARPPSIARVSFTAGTAGEWQVDRIRVIRGPALPDRQPARGADSNPEVRRLVGAGAG
jgi:hypothetical protein